MIVGKKILIGGTLLLSSLAYSQKPCGTEQYRDANFSQEKLMQFLQAEAATRSSADYVYPISAHVFQHDLGFGGLNSSILERAIDTMNARYAPLGIEFYLCGPINYIDRTDLWDFDRSQEENELMPYLIPNTINIFFAREVTSGSTGLCGYSNFPWSTNDFIVMNNGCTANGATLSHELGHYFGLLHTHSPGELVSRVNCSFAGDECCDTPADPTLDNNNVNQNCEYIGTETDFNGNSYMPMVENIMSYAPAECRNTFTTDQTNRARFYASTERNYFNCSVSSIDEDNLLNSIKLYPNPVTNKVNIQSEWAIEKVEVFDLSLKLLISNNGLTALNTSIDVDELTRGTFVMKISLTDGRVVSKRFVKI